MLETDELHRLIRASKRGPLVPPGAGVAVSYGRDEVRRLLPHRPPMLFVDGVDVVDLPGEAVRGHRTLEASHVGFDGHFPEEPVLPGVLVVEAMGQLGLTLDHFVNRDRIDVPPDAAPRRVRATHIHHATFIAPFRPGDTMTLHAKVAHNDYTMVTLGQAWKGDALAALAIFEVLVDG